MSDLRTLLPEVLLLGGAVGCLLLGSWTPRQRQGRVVLLAGLVVLAAGAVSAHALGQAATSAYAGTVTVDALTGILRLSVLVSLLVVLMLVRHELADSPRESEVVVLLLLGGLGVLVLGASTDLAVLTVAFLLASIPLYGLIGLSPGTAAPEAVMKTYLLGALAGIWLMLGAAVLAGLTGTTAYSDLGRVREAPTAAAVAGVVLVVLGLLFKAGSVPMHFWVPDAVEGASTTAAAFLTTVPKLGAVVGAARLLEALPAQERWGLLVAGLAAAGMVVGNLAALTQSRVRRLLGWSAVGQVGFLRRAGAAHDRGLAGHRTRPARTGDGAGRGAARPGGYAAHGSVRGQAAHVRRPRRGGVDLAGRRGRAEHAGRAGLLPALAGGLPDGTGRVRHAGRRGAGDRASACRRTRAATGRRGCWWVRHGRGPARPHGAGRARDHGLSCRECRARRVPSAGTTGPAEPGSG